MATANRTIPLSWTDNLLSIQGQIEAYHALVEAALASLAANGQGNAKHLARGLNLVFEPLQDDLEELLNGVAALSQPRNQSSNHEARGGL